jgi:hypothetical protein
MKTTEFLWMFIDCLDSRLKLMQITSLIARDGFMASLNISIPTDDFIERLEDFGSIWHYDDDFGFGLPEQMAAGWNDLYSVDFTRVLHPKGFCFTFNIPKFSEVFHGNE